MSADDAYAGALDDAVAEWRRRERPRPDVLLVAGSGLSVALGEPVIPTESMVESLPFAAGGIEGHPLSLELLESESGVRCLYFRGRLHAYQGYSAAQVVYCARLAARLGVRAAVVTNASGGIYDGARPGDLVLLRDHINLTGLNPLVGDWPRDWGPQFPDLMAAYSPRLRRLAREVAAAQDVELREGVYVGVLGPSYETPAEVEAFRRLGGDLVGMSTVLEIIALRHLGVPCLGLSLVTNAAAGTSEDSVLDHGDVLEVASRAAQRVQRVLRALLDDRRLIGS